MWYVTHNSEERPHLRLLSGTTVGKKTLPGKWILLVGLFIGCVKEDELSIPRNAFLEQFIETSSCQRWSSSVCDDPVREVKYGVKWTKAVDRIAYAWKSSDEESRPHGSYLWVGEWDLPTGEEVCFSVRLSGGTFSLFVNNDPLLSDVPGPEAEIPLSVRYPIDRSPTRISAKYQASQEESSISLSWGVCPPGLPANFQVAIDYSTMPSELQQNVQIWTQSGAIDSQGEDVQLGSSVSVGPVALIDSSTTKIVFLGSALQSRAGVLPLDGRSTVMFLLLQQLAPYLQDIGSAQQRINEMEKTHNEVLGRLAATVDQVILQSGYLDLDALGEHFWDDFASILAAVLTPTTPSRPSPAPAVRRPQDVTPGVVFQDSIRMVPGGSEVHLTAYNKRFYHYRFRIGFADRNEFEDLTGRILPNPNSEIFILPSRIPSFDQLKEALSGDTFDPLTTRKTLLPPIALVHQELSRSPLALVADRKSPYVWAADALYVMIAGMGIIAQIEALFAAGGDSPFVAAAISCIQNRNLSQDWVSYYAAGNVEAQWRSLRAGIEECAMELVDAVLAVTGEKIGSAIISNLGKAAPRIGSAERGSGPRLSGKSEQKAFRKQLLEIMVKVAGKVEDKVAGVADFGLYVVDFIVRATSVTYADIARPLEEIYTLWLPPSGQFVAEYFEGTELSAFDQRGVRFEDKIDYDWAKGGPEAIDVNSEKFSARWEGRFSFNDAEYTFVAGGDDGTRLYLDNERIFDDWSGGALELRAITRKMTSGEHLLRFEYFESGGKAAAHLSWEMGKCTESKKEICNLKDDDCDGLVDEDIDGGSCGSGFGECGNGKLRCYKGNMKCEVPQASSEVCDGRDNDCDASTDEGGDSLCYKGEKCYAGLGCRENRCGNRTCDWEEEATGLCQQDCSSSLPGTGTSGTGGSTCTTEVCDGKDNDCDGQTDEGVKNACGGCGLVPSEVCDGKDNDCDAQTDEGSSICPSGQTCQGTSGCATASGGSGSTWFTSPWCIFNCGDKEISCRVTFNDLHSTPQWHLFMLDVVTPKTCRSGCALTSCQPTSATGSIDGVLCDNSSQAAFVPQDGSGKYEFNVYTKHTDGKIDHKALLYSKTCP